MVLIVLYDTTFSRGHDVRCDMMICVRRAGPIAHKNFPPTLKSLSSLFFFSLSFAPFAHLFIVITVRAECEALGRRLAISPPITRYPYIPNMIESPTKTSLPLELHSPNISNIRQNGTEQPVKGTPEDDDNESTFQLSPIVHVGLFSPSNMSVSDDNKTNATLLGDERDDVNDVVNVSFPINRDEIEIQSPTIANEDEEEVHDETEEERMQREIEESEALARQLMGKDGPDHT